MSSAHGHGGQPKIYGKRACSHPATVGSIPDATVRKKNMRALALAKTSVPILRNHGIYVRLTPWRYSLSHFKDDRVEIAHSHGADLFMSSMRSTRLLLPESCWRRACPLLPRCKYATAKQFRNANRADEAAGKRRIRQGSPTSGKRCLIWCKPIQLKTAPRSWSAYPEERLAGVKIAMLRRLNVLFMVLKSPSVLLLVLVETSRSPTRKKSGC